MTNDHFDTIYTEEFYKKISTGSRRSASVIVPMLVDWLKPKSVIDVGCGVGSWTIAFRDCGVPKYLGIDGEHAVKHLLLPRDNFLAADLTKPLDLTTRFDLALCVGVGEQIPKSALDKFLSSLSNVSDTIVFSAACPQQSGWLGVNDQPLSYWAKKFEDLGYQTLDCLRPHIWGNREIEWWYRQNILLFSRAPNVTANPAIAPSRRSHSDPTIDVVHPEGFEFCVGKLVKRIEALHKSYRARIQEAKAEVWKKKSEETGGGATYEDVWDRQFSEATLSVKTRGTGRQQEPDIYAPADVDTILDTTFPILSWDAPAVFVEIGAGAGRFTVPILRRHPKARLLAFDVSGAYLSALEDRLHADELLTRASVHRLDDDPDTLVRTVIAARLGAKVDVVFSYDAMTYVDLPTLTIYLLAAGVLLRPGGVIVMNFADPNTEEGATLLFQTSRQIYAEMGRPSAKFSYISRDIISSMLARFGFETTFKSSDNRSSFFMARLVDAERASAAAAAAGLSEAPATAP